MPTLPRRSRLVSLLSGAGALALLGTVLAGCATSREPATARYRPADNEMIYRARPINLGTMFRTGGMSRDPSVALGAWAVCAGENCRPDRAWLSFRLRATGRSNVLSSRDVRITTDDNVHNWPESRDRFNSANPFRGGSSSELTRIRMTLDTFRDIARSNGTVSGSIGGEDFSLSYDDRAPLRAMLDEIDVADRAAQEASVSS